MKKHMKETLAILFAAAALASCATAEGVKATSAVSAVEASAPYAKAGFYTTLDSDGRLWVFPEGSEDLATYKEKGKPVRQVRRIAAGPQGQTIISTEVEHIDAYLVAKEGFYASVDSDGRLWVFPMGHADHEAYLEKGKPVRQVRRIAAGPQGQTVISTEVEHIDAYLSK